MKTTKPARCTPSRSTPKEAVKKVGVVSYNYLTAEQTVEKFGRSLTVVAPEKKRV